MAQSYGADTIRILISTDNHVGYNENDPVRGDDSWKSFDEVMCLANERDVDMVLLAGDLFHENKPSRKSIYQVMKSLRQNCYSDKPCELELLSDAQENFAGPFNYANYEDPDINVGIPVFSIHGNHDDPSGEGHLAALDILQVSGLLNYYGRTPESDNVQVRPVLLRKGNTKLALYGMSNVRDQRLFRTFRDGKVKFFRPTVEQDEWFNLMSVHQNHHAHSETNYLPERFLPDFLDLVIWGHEHECLINPRLNPETRFHVMQPGSSVATSLVAGEAVPKHVAVLSITGREFHVEPIKLKTVRPFVMREISLYEDKAMKRIAKKDDNRTEVTRYLKKIVDEMIDEANQEWLDSQPQQSAGNEPLTPPLPLIRLRVEVTTPEGGSFDTENPQRFSNRFVGRVANVNDVVQFHRKKRAGQTAKFNELVADPNEESISHLTALDTVKVEKLVREFLQAQSLTILPENSFGDAVSQFVDKDDKHAMEIFLNESLDAQNKHLLQLDQRGNIDAETSDVEERLEFSEDEAHLDGSARMSKIEAELARHRAQLEEQFARGIRRRTHTAAGRRRFKPRPENWDSDLDGAWEDQPGALIVSAGESDDGMMDVDEETPAPPTTTGRGRGRGRGRGTRATPSGRGRGKTAASATVRTSRRQAVVDDEAEEASETPAPVRTTRGRGAQAAPTTLLSDDDDDNDDDDGLFVPEQPRAPPKRTLPSSATTSSRTSRNTATNARQSKTPARPAPSTTSTRTRAPAARASQQQSTLNFTRASQSQAQTPAPAQPQRRRGPFIEEDDIEEEDEDDAFDAAPLASLRSRR